MVTKIIKEHDATFVGQAGYMSSTSKKIIKHFNKSPQTHWWLAEPDTLYRNVEAATETLESQQSTRRMLNIRFARMYANMEVLGFPYSSINKSIPDNSSATTVTFNIIQSVIDAAAAKIAKDQPKVSFITSGAADYFLKLRANNLTKYMAGLFKQTKVYENAELVFRDACVLGTGFLHIYEQDKEMFTDWVPNDEIRIDELDGMKQKPRSMHRCKLVPKDMLMHQYPDFEDKILSAQSALQGKIQIQSTTEMVRVTESWHIPSTKKSKDGLHCITIENATLFSEPYEKDYFPIVAFRWYFRPLGFFGRSITEEILTIQVGINKILKTIQQSQELAAVPIIFIPNEAEIAEDVLLSNYVARMVPYSGGTPPTWVTPVAQNAETYQHLENLIQKAFQIVGLSQASANGQKPAGVDSAVAIREVSDIETGRFAMVANRWEQFFVEVARILTDFSKDMYVKYPELSVSFSEKRILKEIKWKDVDLKDNPFDIQTFPVSSLPDSPAGRIQTITEYIQNGYISKERGMELLQLDPDLESEVNMQTSTLRLTEKWIAKMVKDNVYFKPEPFMNLKLAQDTAQSIYNVLVYDECPEDRLELVRRFILECVDLQQNQQQNQQPMQPQQQPIQSPQPMNSQG